MMRTNSAHKFSTSSLLAISAASTLFCILLTIPLGNYVPLIGSKDTFQYKFLQYLTGASAVFTFELTGQFLAQQDRARRRNQAFQEEDSNVVQVPSAGALQASIVRYQRVQENRSEEVAISIAELRSEEAELRSKEAELGAQMEILRQAELGAQMEIIRQAHRRFDLHAMGIVASMMLGVVAGGLTLANRLPEAGATAVIGAGFLVYSAQMKKEVQEKLGELLDSLEKRPTQSQSSPESSLSNAENS